MASKGPLAFVSVTNAFEPVVRKLSRKLKSDIALSQWRAGMSRGPFWGEVRETRAKDGTPKSGAHIVAPMPSAPARDRLVARINLSSAYGDTFAEPVHDREKLKSYCLKEMTSEAAYRTGIRRMKGSHPLPEGGDRVRVSPAVRDALIRTDRIEPYISHRCLFPLAPARRRNASPVQGGGDLAKRLRPSGLSLERRRRQAASGTLPPALAARFTTGELAALMGTIE